MVAVVVVGDNNVVVSLTDVDPNIDNEKTEWWGIWVDVAPLYLLLHHIISVLVLEEEK